MNNTKKAAQRIANAICELSNATFLLTHTPYCQRLQDASDSLFKTMKCLGYEFAEIDSRRIRKIK